MPEQAAHLAFSNTLDEARQRRLPGEEGVWVLIFGDMVVFAVFFITFFVSRGQHLDVFKTGQQLLDVRLGVLNTMLLLTSSWLVALATRDVRNGGRKTAKLLALAMACGGGFCAVKVVEYSAKIGAGYTLNSSDFFTLYYMYTGIHLVHVLIGIGLLAMAWLRCRTMGGRPHWRFVETTASFWHLVDLLWVVMFPLFYLVV